MTRRNQNPGYNPFAPRDTTDRIGFGSNKAERIAKVKRNSKYANMGDEAISEILTLGAPSHDNFGVRITPSERNALKEIATRHYIKVEPDLNSEATAKAYNMKKACKCPRVRRFSCSEKVGRHDCLVERLGW
jgi:hypothetical protein